MKRIVAFVVLLCVFITPIYANEIANAEIMPLREVATDCTCYFLINNSGVASISFNYNSVANAQSIRIETKIQKRLLLVLWNDVDGGQWTDSFTTTTGSFRHTLQLQKTGTYRAVFHVYAVGSNGSVDDFELTKEYVYE